MLKASHVARTRHAHQVTAAALFLLKQNAYGQYTESLSEGEEPMRFTTWNDKMSADQPQFRYWELVLELELCILEITVFFGL